MSGVNPCPLHPTLLALWTSPTCHPTHPGGGVPLLELPGIGKSDSTTYELPTPLGRWHRVHRRGCVVDIGGGTRQHAAW